MRRRELIIVAWIKKEGRKEGRMDECMEGRKEGKVDGRKEGREEGMVGGRESQVKDCLQQSKVGKK